MHSIGAAHRVFPQHSEWVKVLRVDNFLNVGIEYVGDTARRASNQILPMLLVSGCWSAGIANRVVTGISARITIWTFTAFRCHYPVLWIIHNVVGQT